MLIEQFICQVYGICIILHHDDNEVILFKFRKFLTADASASLAKLEYCLLTEA